MGELILIQKNGELNLNSKNPYRIVTKAEHRQSLLSEGVVNISLDSKAPIKSHTCFIFSFNLSLFKAFLILF